MLGYQGQDRVPGDFMSQTSSSTYNSFSIAASPPLLYTDSEVLSSTNWF